MALVFGPPPPPRFPSGRYTITNPLRRQSGLRLLTANMPEPLRRLIVTAFRRPSPFDGQETPLAVQSAYRQRPDAAALPGMRPRTLRLLALTELEVARRLVEAPRSSISRMTRSTLLVAQGVYLRSLYAALVIQSGSAEAALAEFERLLLSPHPGD